MRSDPVLASKRLAPGVLGYRVPLLMKVKGGLHYMRGNTAPYFSITTDIHRVGFPNQCSMGGCQHELIEQYFPGRFTDLIALHLSDTDGVPMHAVANAWYWYAGTEANGCGERYHGGNTDAYGRGEVTIAHPHPLSQGRQTMNLWSREQCFEKWRKYLRLTEGDARFYDALIRSKWNWPDMKAEHAAIVEELKPHWKQQAEACIAKHNLVVYGDKWGV